MYGHSFRITTLLPSWVDLGIVIKERTYKDTGCILILMIFSSYIESDALNLWLINGRFLTISSHFFAKYMNIFHKTEVQTVILRCWTGLKLNWFKSYDSNAKNRKSAKNAKNAKNITQMRSFLQNRKKRKRKYLCFVS